MQAISTVDYIPSDTVHAERVLSPKKERRFATTYLKKAVTGKYLVMKWVPMSINDISATEAMFKTAKFLDLSLLSNKPFQKKT